MALWEVEVYVCERERDQERCYLTMVSSASSSLILFSFMSIWERRTLACSVASLVCRRRSHFSLSSMSFSLARAFTASSLSCSTAHSEHQSHTREHTHTHSFQHKKPLMNLYVYLSTYCQMCQSLMLFTYTDKIQYIAHTTKC